MGANVCARGLRLLEHPLGLIGHVHQLVQERQAPPPLADARSEFDGLFEQVDGQVELAELGLRCAEDEQDLLAMYEQLKEMSSREDLAPSSLMNVRQAMVMMWNACTDLALIYEEPGVD